MPWPSISRFFNWLRRRKDLFVGIVGVAVEEMATAFPGGSVAVKLIKEVADHGTKRLLKQDAEIPEIKAAGQAFPHEQLDEINDCLEKLTGLYKGLLDHLEAQASQTQDQQSLTQYVRQALRERADLNREFTAHRREVRRMILSLGRVEEMLAELMNLVNEQGRGQRQITAGMVEFKEYLVNLPGFMEFLQLPADERSAVFQAHDHFLDGRREEGAATLLDALKKRGVGRKTILEVLDSVYLGKGNPGRAVERQNEGDAKLSSERREEAVATCYEGHIEAVTCVAFSPDSRLLLSGSKDGTVRMWDVTTGKELHRLVPSMHFPAGFLLPRRDGVLAVTFTGEGRQVLAVVEAGRFVVWDAESGRQVHCFGPNQSKFSKVYTERLRKQECRPDEVPGCFRRVVISSDGHYALIYGYHGDELECTRIYDLERRKLLKNDDCDHSADCFGCTCLALASAGPRFIAAAYWLDAEIDSTEVLIRKGLATVHDDSIEFSDAALEDRLVIADSSRRFRPTYRGWDAADRLESMAFSCDRKHLLLGCQNGSLCLLNLTTDKVQVFSGHQKPVRAVAFSPNGRMAVSGSDDHTVRVWSMPNLGEVSRFEGHAGPIQALACSPDGRWAASASSDKTLRLWQLLPSK